MVEEKARGSGGDLSWCLRRLGGSQERLLLQEGEEVTLGRGIGVTYQLVSKDSPLMISRVHCIFRQNAEGRWTLADNKSLNGVWLDKVRVEPQKPYVLTKGSCVQLGVPLTNAETAEFEYEVVQENRFEIHKFLMCPQPGKSKQPRTKRKLTCEDAEASGTEGTSTMSKAKLHRPLREGEDSAKPVKVELSKQPTVKVSIEGSGLEASEDVDSMTATQLQGICYSHVAKMRQLLAEVQCLNTALQEEQAALGDNQKTQSSSKDGQYLLRRKEVIQNLITMKRIAQEQQAESLQELDKELAKQLDEIFQEISLLMDEVNAPDSQKLIDVQLKHTQEEERKAEAQREEVLQQMNDVLDNELQCIICSEHFIEAVTLNCAHSFCSYCIQSWRKRKDECPICRQEITSQTRSLVLDNCINCMVDKLSADMKERRIALIQERKDLALEEPPIPPDSDSSSFLSDMSLLSSGEDLDSDTEIDDLSFSEDQLDFSEDDYDDDDDDDFILFL